MMSEHGCSPMCLECRTKKYANLGPAYWPPVEPVEAVKADADKPRHELLPFAALEAVSAVLAYGAVKYAPHGYRNGGGLAWSRLLGGVLRHLFAWGRGEDKDPETGLSHLAHACCGVLFLLTYEIEGGGNDDRFAR